MRFLIPIALTLTLLSASNKEALLIGNSKYEHLDRLSSPSQDIPALASKLRDMGFEVVALYNQDEKSMKKAIKDFKKRLLRNPNAIALFYYSGHGSQAYGESYLIPIDGDTRDQADVEADGIKVETIAQKMATANTKANILFLDACRDVPIGAMGGTKGLGQVKRQPSSTLILYSTSKNKTANDDRVFNRVVLSKLGLNQPFSLVVNDISYTVGQKTGGSQVPELLSTGLPNIVLGDDIPPTSKWITPKDSVCKANGGEIDKNGICQANWENTKKICSASGGKLPTREDFHKVIRDCGGIPNTAFLGKKANKNRNNSHYQNCYKQKGFSNNNWYWTSEKYDSSNSWGVYFRHGNVNWYYKSNKYYVLCAR